MGMKLLGEWRAVPSPYPTAVAELLRAGGRGMTWRAGTFVFLENTPDWEA